MASDPKIKRPLIFSEILLLLFILTDFLKQRGFQRGRQEIQRKDAANVKAASQFCKP